MSVCLCYPQGKYKALTMSYDDGRNADKRLVNLFNRNGIRGTFHINSGIIGQQDRVDKDELALLYRGHEISAHTLTHPTIARIPKELLVHEVMEDRKNLERIAGYTVRGMSYPNGSYNREIKEMLPFLGIEYARVVETSGDFGMPDDWLEWRATCHHKQELMRHAEALVKLNQPKRLHLMYVWGHSYEFDNDNNWQLMEEFCQFIGRREEIWYATNIEIVDYVKAYRQLRFSAACDFVYNPSSLSIWLTVNNQIVEIPGGSTVSFS